MARRAAAAAGTPAATVLLVVAVMFAASYGDTAFNRSADGTFQDLVF